MASQIEFYVPSPCPEVERLTINYFLLNKYYRLQSTDGLRFRGYQEMQSALSPGRLTDSVEVNILETPTGCRVTCKLKLISDRTTSIDEEYFTAFLEHFKQTLQQQNITIFSGEGFEKESKSYSKLYWLVTGVVTVSGLAIVWITKIDFLLFALVILSQPLAYWLIDRKRKQKTV